MKHLSTTIKITQHVPDNMSQEEFEQKCIIELSKNVGKEGDIIYICENK